ncbi:hypothetical protein EOD40_15580 [Flavobacterium sufflavum]|uniref:Uncharacterized protein n=1 Tax=Flavobacterium sufflavum TaxID=1921138 RepID=A0A437KN80_9FLAO|nr:MULTISPECIES: hypothetical protein [Flavobacterium]MBA0885506.1 hypothetical protein [Flavobacterium undicola]RVT72830.1 hypothetical protein EOD40_15580 [Flavobacterium sufflavum]
MDDIDYKKNIEKLERQVKNSLKLINQIRPIFYFLGFFSTFCFFLENVQNLQYLKNNISTISLVGISLLFGFLLFLYRENYRLGYGILEIIVGLLTIISLFENMNNQSRVLDIEVYVKLGGGLYIIVRGMDNVFKNIENKRIGIWLKNTYGIGKK